MALTNRGSMTVPDHYIHSKATMQILLFGVVDRSVRHAQNPLSLSLSLSLSVFALS
mgnify:CR=1 FL=1